MFSTGSQIRAARALLGWHRDDLAAAAKLHSNSVAYWEAKASIPTCYEPVGCMMMREALERAGVVPIADPGPGVQFVDEAQFSRDLTQNLGRQATSARKGAGP